MVLIFLDFLHSNLTGKNYYTSFRVSLIDRVAELATYGWVYNLKMWINPNVRWNKSRCLNIQLDKKRLSSCTENELGWLEIFAICKISVLTDDSEDFSHRNLAFILLLLIVGVDLPCKA